MKTNDAFILRNIYGKYILMPIHSNDTSNDPILLNEVAASIWNEALHYKELEQIMSNIAHSYKILEDSSEMVAVKQFIEHMITIGLLIAA